MQTNKKLVEAIEKEMENISDRIRKMHPAQYQQTGQLLQHEKDGLRKAIQIIQTLNEK